MTIEREMTKVMAANSDQIFIIALNGPIETRNYEYLTLSRGESQNGGTNERGKGHWTVLRVGREGEGE